MSQNVFVVGANGFLGGYLVSNLTAKGINIISYLRESKVANILDGQVKAISRDVKKWESDIKLYRPSVIYFLAGVSSVGYAIEHPVEEVCDISGLIAAIVSAIGLSKLPVRFVYFSSAAVYGNPVSLPIKETDACVPISVYGIGKLTNEQIISAYSEYFGVDAYILRIFSAYGVGLKKQLFFDLASKIQKAVFDGSREVKLFGTGNETRDFIHGSDIAEAAYLIGMVKNTEKGVGVYNIASGQELAINNLSRQVLSVSGFADQLRIVFNMVDRPSDPKFWRADISKLHSIGFRPSVRLQDGLREYWDWMIGVGSK